MKLYFVILIVAPITFSQWETGGSYKIKNQTPVHGFGVSISRDLPVQSVFLGFKLRAEVNIFRENAEVDFSGIKKQKFLSEDYNFHLIGEFFLTNFYPYLGFGFGFGELNSGRQNWQGFVLSLIIGNRFLFSDLINPYFEIQGYYYFAEFDRSKWGRGMLEYQLRGAIGVIILINTL